MFTLKGTDNRVLLFSTFIILPFILYPLFWSFFPGVLLLLCPIRKRINVVEMIGFVVTLSLSFWISTSWIIRIATIPIQPFAYLVIFATLCLSVIFRKRIRLANIEFAREDRIVLSVLGIAILLKFLPLMLVRVPPGADMSMHTYLAHLIVTNGVIPSTFEPLLPIELYSSYALGFHYLTALVSFFSQMPVYRAGLIVSCFSQALLPLGTYIFLKRFSGRWDALFLAIVVSFVSGPPRSLFAAGGNPTVLAVDILLISSVWLVDMKGSMSWIRRGVLSIILTAAPLTHSIPSTGYVYVVVPVLFFLMGSAVIKRREWTGNLIRNIFCVAVFAGLLLVPYLLSLKIHLSQGEINWVRNWQNVAFLGSIGDVPYGLERRLGGSLLFLFALEKKLGSIFLLISGLGFLTVLLRGEKKKYPFILYSFIFLLLIINGRYWLLPLSYLLYPDRVAFLLAFPMAVLGTSFISWILYRYRGRPVRVTLFTGLLVITGWFYSDTYIFSSIHLSAVTDADLRAFEWIEEKIDEKAVFLNNRGDGGLWIPGIILRPIVIIHSNPVYLDEFRAEQLRMLPRYVYIGAKMAYKDQIFLKREDLESRPELCRKIYDEDGAVIFKALDSQALREYFWNLDRIRRGVEFNRKLMGG